MYEKIMIQRRENWYKERKSILFIFIVKDKYAQGSLENHFDVMQRIKQLFDI